MSILNFLGLHNKKQTDADLCDQIISYTKSIVLREDLIKGITDNLNSVPVNKLQRLSLIIQTYVSLEDFITHNKPLIVQNTYTKEKLREEIRSKFNVFALPRPFQLYFLPEKEKVFLLYSGYTQALAEYIIKQIGVNGLQNLISKATAGTIFEGIRVTDEKTMATFHEHLPDITLTELSDIFRKVNTSLFQHIAKSFGEHIALKLTKENFQQIKEIYDYDLVSRYLRVIPVGALDKERVTYMTREDLEKQAMIAAEEKLRREMAEKSAQTLEAKLLASVSGLTLGFILIDTNNTIITINDSAKNILMIRQEIFTIKDIENQMSTSFDFTGIIEQSKKEMAPIEFNEVEWNNMVLHITVSPILLTTPKKEYIGSVILIDDVTMSKKLERTKDEFFAIASHELRTPLTAIRGSVSILKSHYADKLSEGDIPKLIGFIDQSADRLIEIVNEFLNVSRLEQGRIIFKLEAFSISDLIDEVIKELSSLADSKHIFLRFEDTHQKYHASLADRERTKQVLVNLIGNAIKFTSTGGVTISVEEKDNHVFVRVKDTGEGISEANQKLLFRKFQQAQEDVLTHDVNKGTGLGLYISKKFIENMGGTIFLEHSEVNKGASFIFSLPCLEKYIN